MIKASELRIGNWVAAGVQYCKINSIHTVPEISETHYRVSGFIDNNPQYCFYDYDVEPIPLTPEILEKAGFVETGDQINNHDADLFQLGSFRCWFSNYLPGSVWINIDPDDSGNFRLQPEIGYLHQLQNLYFSLTGKELEINFQNVKELTPVKYS